MTAPTVSFSNTIPPSAPLLVKPLATGAVLKGQVKVPVRCTDEVGLDRVEFFIEAAGQWQPVLPSIPLSGLTGVAIAAVDTTLVSNGPHQLLAQVFSVSGENAYALLDVTVANANPNPGVSEWIKELVRPVTTGEAVGIAVKIDPRGNAIVVGNFKGTVSFGNVKKTALGGSDIFIRKVGTSGGAVWVKTFGGISDDSIAAVAVDIAGNIYTTGYFFGTADFGGGPLTSHNGVYGSDIFIAKYDSSGGHVWSMNLGSTLGNNAGSGIALDPAGNVFVVGKIYGNVDLGGGVITSRAGSADGFVLKLSGKTGAYLWAQSFGGNESDTVKGVAVDASGDVVIVGSSYGDIDFGGGLHRNQGSAALFMVKYSANGEYLWSRVAGGTGPDTADGVAIDANRNIFLVGSYYYAVVLGDASITATAPQDSGVYVAKYNAAGVAQWVRSIAHETPNGGENVRGVAVDVDGSVVVTGNVSGRVNFGNGVATYGDANIYVAKYDKQGKNLWAKRSANMGRCAGYAIATYANRSILSTGFVQGDVNMDGLLIASPGQQLKSAFLFKVTR